MSVAQDIALEEEEHLRIAVAVVEERHTVAAEFGIDLAEDTAVLELLMVARKAAVAEAALRNLANLGRRRQ